MERRHRRRPPGRSPRGRAAAHRRKNQHPDRTVRVPGLRGQGVECGGCRAGASVRQLGLGQVRAQYRGSWYRNYAPRRRNQRAVGKGEIRSSGFLAPAGGRPVSQSRWGYWFGGFACRGCWLVFCLDCVMKQSGLSTKELRQRHFPQVVVFIVCLVLVMTAISWITIPRAVIMASVLIVGLIIAMAHKTFVAQNVVYSAGFAVVCSLISMAGIAGAQWGTEKFVPALIAVLVVSVLVTIRQARVEASDRSDVSRPGRHDA